MKPIEDAIKKALRYGTPGEGVTYDQFAANLIKLAMEGNGTAIKEILNRVDGPVTEQVKHEINDTSGLTNEERAARIAAVLDRGRARRAGCADVDASDVS